MIFIKLKKYFEEFKKRESFQNSFLLIETNLKETLENIDLQVHEGESIRENNDLRDEMKDVKSALTNTLTSSQKSSIIAIKGAKIVDDSFMEMEKF